MLEGCIALFIEKVIEVQLISINIGESFTSVYADIKANLEFINSAEKVQTYYQRLLKILDNLGKPVADVGKSIAAQLSTVTGKIYMYVSRMVRGWGKSFPLDR